MKTSYLCIIVLIVLFFPASVSAIEWARVYGWTNDFGASSIQQTADGGYILAGSALVEGSIVHRYSDAWVLKLDSDGNVSWQKAYGEQGGGDYASTIQQTADGGYIVAGLTHSFISSYYAAFLMKLDSDGNVSWRKTYRGQSGFDSASTIQQTADGGYIVAGSTTSDTGYSAALLMKLDESGNIVWQKTYGQQYGVAQIPTIQQTADGGYIVAGGAPSNPDYIGALVMKLDRDGNVSWQKAYGQQPDADYASTIQQTADGGYIVAGQTHYSEIDYWSALLMKLDSDGNVSWQKNCFPPRKSLRGT
jgi:hypothetical protein